MTKEIGIEESGASASQTGLSQAEPEVSALSADSELRDAALDFVIEVQNTLLKRDEILIDFPLEKIGRLLDLLGPETAQ